MLRCDVIIPAYNAEKVVGQTLDALFAQDVPAGWTVGVIIVDDGSTDATSEIIARYQKQAWPYRVIRQENAGAAAARNRAILASGAEIIFMLGADICLRPGALATHLRFHDRFPDRRFAALGLLHWDFRLHPSPLMEWMVHGGAQNNFDALLGETEAIPRHHFYGSHLSLKRIIAAQHFFSTRFPGAAWEDLELGRRLAEIKLRLRVLHDAVGLHRHLYSDQEIWRRQRGAGRGLVVYQELYPILKIIPRRTIFWRVTQVLMYYGCLAALLRSVVHFTADRWSTPRLFALVTQYEFWEGVKAGLSARQV